MNWKTTIILLTLAGTGVAVWLVGPKLPSPLADAPAEKKESATLAIFEHELTGDKLQSIRVSRGKETLVELKRNENKEWSLPGNWPVQKQLVDKLVQRFTQLRSRFATVPLPEDQEERDATLTNHGLVEPAFTVTLRSGATEYVLRFGEGKTEENAFFRPVFVRLDNRPEIVRLEAGVLSELGLPAYNYQLPRLFPTLRELKSADSPEKVERLSAARVVIRQRGDNPYQVELEKKDNNWRLNTPSVDRLSQSALESLLEAAADLWAEKFIPDTLAESAKSLSGMKITLPATVEPRKLDNGKTETSAAAWRRYLRETYKLDKAERELHVARTLDDPSPVVLRIGDVVRPASVPPPRPNPTAEPPENLEELRLAELEGNDQLFLIKGARLGSIFKPRSSLRNTTLAQIDLKDVRRIDVKQGKSSFTFTRTDEKSSWKLSEDDKAALSSKNVEDIVTRLLGGTRSDPFADAAAFAIGYRVAGVGMDDPLCRLVLEAGLQKLKPRVPESATESFPPIAIEVQTEKKKDSGTETSTVRVEVVGRDAVNQELLVRVRDAAGEWQPDRIPDNLLTVALRPARAYRDKFFAIKPDELERLNLVLEGKQLAFEKQGKEWRLTEPAKVRVEDQKITEIVEQLNKLEPVDFVDVEPDEKKLESEYGLGKSAQSLTVRIQGKEETLLLGKQREGRLDSYARLQGQPTIFTVGADLKNSLSADAVTFLPKLLWQIERNAVSGIHIKPEGMPAFDLEKSKDGWKLGKPLDAPASNQALRGLLDLLQSPPVERYLALSGEDAKHGFDNPRLRVKLKLDKDGATRELIVGKKVDDKSDDRYVRAGDSSAIAVMAGPVVASLEGRKPLDLVDEVLWRVPPATVQRIDSVVAGAKLAIQPQDKAWRIVEGPGAPFEADIDSRRTLEGLLTALHAEKYAVYGSTIDAKSYGLDAPHAMLTVATEDAEKKKKTYVLKVGKPVEGKPDQRYAQLDNAPGVAILTANDTRLLTRTHLDYVDHKVLSVPAPRVTALLRQAGMDTLAILKEGEDWQITQPVNLAADVKSVQKCLAALASLKAARVVEFPLQNAAKYGLDKPAATFTVKLKSDDDKPAKHTIEFGNLVDPAGKERYAKLEGSSAVYVLDADTMRLLDGGLLVYRSKQLTKFNDAEKISLEQGPRKLQFVRSAQGNWSIQGLPTATLDDSALENFLKNAGKLEAEELLEEKASDPKKYGFDKPAARWRFELDGKEVLDLVVGKTDPSGTKRYARLGNDGFVVLLTPEMTGFVTREFRPTKIFTAAPAAVDVTELRLTGGTKSLILRRDAGTWKVDGKPNEKLETATVDDTVAALVNLTVERYFVDKDADRKLYGLEPPAYILEAIAGDKKVVLHLGATFESTTKRYACQPEKEKSEVYLIAEPDSSRLTRDLDAFKKPLALKPAP